MLHKGKLAFKYNVQNRHGSSLLLDKPSFVMLPLTITLFYTKLTFKLLPPYPSSVLQLSHSSILRRQQEINEHAYHILSLNKSTKIVKGNCDNRYFSILSTCQAFISKYLSSDVVTCRFHHHVLSCG